MQITMQSSKRAPDSKTDGGQYLTLTTVDALGGEESSCTFMRKNVILVRRSTVDLRSCRRAGSLAGNVFCKIMLTIITQSIKTIANLGNRKQGTGKPFNQKNS